MTAGMQRAGRQPGEVPAGRHQHSLHPFLVHLPIGAWVCSLVFDVASRFDQRPAVLAAGSKWLIGIGVLGAIAAGIAGIFDWAAIEPRSAAFRSVTTHMVINVALIFAYAGNFVWRLRNQQPAAPVSVGLIVLSAGCVVALAVSAHLGGRLTHGSDRTRAHAG